MVVVQVESVQLEQLEVSGQRANHVVVNLQGLQRVLSPVQLGRQVRQFVLARRQELERREISDLRRQELEQIVVHTEGVKPR